MRKHVSSGAFGISSPGISERISASAPNLGAAISKALNLANRIQRELKASTGEDTVTISITPLGGERVARIVVHRHLIETFATVGTR